VLMILFKKFCFWLCVILVVLQVCLIGEFCDCVVLFVRSCPSLVLIVLRSLLMVLRCCIYKRGTLATKGVSLGHQGFDK